MMNKGILCVGTITVDYAKKIDRLPVLEELVIIDEVTFSNGGPGLNIAFDLRQLDSSLEVEAIGCVGNDSNGQYIIDRTSEIGIINSRMQRSPGSMTCFTDAMTLNSNGRRTFFHHPGSNNDLDLDAIDLTLTKPRILHVGAPGIHRKADDHAGGKASQWVKILKRARELGIETNMEMVHLDAELEKELVLPCLPYLSSIIVNESEAGSLVDMPAKVDGADAKVDWQLLENIVKEIIKKGVSKLAVIHSPAGAVAADASGATWRQGSVKVPTDEIKGTTGAGDAFASGVVYGLHEGWGVQECLKLGVATAAQNIKSFATAQDIKPFSQTLAEADKYGYRSVS
jgi:sugar/nucleoside kinase (ribokinase family)